MMESNEGYGTARGRLLGEDDLRQISRSIRTYIPQKAPQDGDDDDQLNHFHQLLEDALFTSSSSGLGPAHRVAAWNTLCSLIDQAVESKHLEVKNYIRTGDIWKRAFQLYLSHAQSARPKSSRQLMATLTNAIHKASGDEQTKSKQIAARELVRCLRDFESPAKAKASAQFLSHLLSKGVLSIDAILGPFDQSRFAEEQDVQRGQVQALLETSLRWLSKGDFGSTVATLVSTILDKVAEYPEIDAQPPHSTPLWAKPLERATLDNATDVDALRAHILPTLFKRSFADFVSFLDLLGLQATVPRARPQTTITSSNENLLFATLQTGKEMGLVLEHDGMDMLNDGIALHLPLAVIGRLLTRSSRTARLTGLTLLINSHTTTRPFSPRALELIKTALRVYLADVDADFRSDVFSAVQKLVDRMRAITAMLSRQQIAWQQPVDSAASPPKLLASHKGFLDWLLRSLTQDLRPTATYQRHISALKCLHILARSGLDESVAQKRWSRTAMGETKWPFHTNVMTAPLLRILLDLLMDPFDDVRQTASSILDLFDFSPDVALLKRQQAIDTALPRAERMMLDSGRADHADGVAHLYAARSRTLAAAANTQPSRTPIISQLTEKLEQMLVFARENLSEAVAKYPLHGLLTSIRYVLESNSSDEYTSIVSRLFVDLQEVWAVVKPVLCNDAPEGYQSEEVDISADSTKETLSYCWRALKEASLLLNVLVIKHGSSDDIGDLVERMSDLCFTQLAELRHRGAFSTVAQTWTTCCTRCTELRSFDGQPLLEKWYNNVLDMLRKNITINTRRSAGLPSLLCGILIAQKDERLFHQALKNLEEISRQEVDAALAEGGNLPQVHAMNCIKDILKNTRLGEQSEKYVPMALKLAADALRSEAWAIRNCGLMLFRAVIDRLLGTDSSHFEDDIVSQKQISAEEYPELLDVILDLLPQASASTGEVNERNEGVFPALRLLQHTRVPNARLQDVKAAVLTLTENNSWHVRDKAARATAALLSINDPFTTLSGFQSVSKEAQPRQNLLHGMLLTAQYFIRALRRNHSESNDHFHEQRDFLTRECDKIFQFAWSSVHSKAQCHSTRASCVDLMRECSVLLNLLGYRHRVSFDEPGTEPGPLINGTERPGSEAEVFRALTLESAQDPSAAVFNQAMLRFLAQELLHRSFDEKNGDVVMQTVDRLIAADRNACEYFFHALTDNYSSLEEHAAGSVMRGAVSIMHSDKSDVVLKCVVQEALLNMSSAFEDLVTVPHAETHLLGSSYCNKRYADNSLQLQAVQLEQSSRTSGPTLEDVRIWSNNCVRAINGHGVHTREAAAEAIGRTRLLWRAMYKTAELRDCFLQLCIAVYDLLVDDDEDIRLLASTITQRIMACIDERETAVYEPIIASQKLLGTCVITSATDEIFAGIAFERAFGMKQGSLVPVAEQLTALSHHDTALFAQEKQNLYIDDAQEVRVWSKLFPRLWGTGVTTTMLAEISRWVVDGLKALKEHAAQNEDGPLGWSSRAETFTLGLRVVYGAEVLFTLVVQQKMALPVQPSALRMALFEAMNALEAAQAHPLWLWEMQRVLTESVSQKTMLLGGHIASKVETPMA